jgi:plasmid stabilization system protein ParE
VGDRIRIQAEGLVQFPESGRRGCVEGTRELVIPRTPYIAATCGMPEGIPAISHR